MNGTSLSLANLSLVTKKKMSEIVGTVKYLPTVLTDGGRQLVHGKRKNWQDCGIRTVSVLLSEGYPGADSYREATELIGSEEKLFGRAGVPWTRVRLDSVDNVLSRLGFITVANIPLAPLWPERARFINVPGLTSEQMLRYLNDLGVDQAVVTLRDHIVAIYEGKYFDFDRMPPSRLVHELWVPKDTAIYWQECWERERSRYAAA